MAPRSTRHQAIRSSKLPTIIIPCLTDLQTLVDRYPGLEVSPIPIATLLDCSSEKSTAPKTLPKSKTTRTVSNTNNNNNNNNTIPKRVKKAKLDEDYEVSSKQNTAGKHKPSSSSISNKSARNVDAGDRENSISNSRATRKSSRAVSNTPQKQILSKQRRSSVRAQSKDVEEPPSDPKPGTAGSKQALVPPKRNQRSATRKSERHSDEEPETGRYLTNMVDDTITLTFGQLIEKYKIKRPPKNPLDVCCGFSLVLTDLHLKPEGDS